MKNHILKILLFSSICTSCDEAVVTESKHKKNDNTKKAHFERQMKKKGYSLKTNGTCDDAIEDTLHERTVVYIDNQSITDSGRTVEFKFKEACCKEYLGDHDINNDTLTFELEQVNDEVCSCICWYRYKLNLPNTQESYSQLKILVKP